MKKFVAVLVLLAAAGIWFWRLAPERAPTESELRRTAGVTAEVTATRPLPQGVEATCLVSNSSPRRAEQIVLRVSLRDADGQTLAANPLASVAELAAGQAREARFVLPCRPPANGGRAEVEVSLVRWKDH